MSVVAKGATISKQEKSELCAQFLSTNRLPGDTLCSRTANAQLGPTKAVDLLQRYCCTKSSEWNTDFSDPYPCHETEAGFLATVTVDEKAGIDNGRCQEPQKNKTLARRYALDAYGMFYGVGEVDGYYYPSAQHTLSVFCESQYSHLVRQQEQKTERGCRIKGLQETHESSKMANPSSCCTATGIVKGRSQKHG